LAGSVAVDVMNCWPAGAGPAAAVKLALPLPSVVTFAKPRNVSPSPYRDGSHDVLEKNSSLKVVFGELFSVPSTVVLPPELLAEVSTGKFWRLLAPVSASPGSFGVTPPGSRSIPSRFEWTEFPRIGFWLLFDSTNTPSWPLWAIVLAAPLAVPPIVF
jgi:hypothetical protein